MKLLRIYLLTALLLTLGRCANSQMVPEAVLVDEFAAFQCEDLWARLDAFRNQMSADPRSIATVELSGKTDDRRGNFYWDSMIRGYFRRYISEERWSVVRTALGTERRVRFWLTPAGGHAPKIDAAEWSFVYPPGIKPFIFTNGDSYSVEIGVCLDVDEIDLLAQALEANPGARLNIVFIVRFEREYQRRKRNVINQLEKQHSIAAARIRTFKKIRTKPNPYGIEPITEYWFVP